MTNTTPNKADALIDTINEGIQIINSLKEREYRVKKKLVILPPEGEALILGDLHGDLETLRVQI
jgi:hypothetical protein